jgi:hypothetical protein
MTSTLAINRRPLQIALAVLLLAAVVFEAVKHGLWAPAALGLLGPDIALFAGLKDGRLNPRGVPLYNALHSYYAPVVLMAVAATGVIGLGFFVGGLAWSAHIAVDRALGYGLRTRDGFQR